MTRQEIVAAALTLLDRVGIEGLTTRVLAEELGIKGPSLYWHFKNKQELLDHMGEAMMAEALRSSEPMHAERDWEKLLVLAADTVRNAARSRRDGHRVIAGARPTGASPLFDFPAVIQTLRGAGFSDAEARVAYVAVSRFALGWVLGAQADDGRPTTFREDVGYRFGLQALILGLDVVRSAAPSDPRRLERREPA